MAMTDPTNRPLWQVMRQADRSAASDYRSPEARILRAIAEEIAKRDPDNSMSALAVEEWLRAEADRAEAGE
jgi:hypothetical protein